MILYRIEYTYYFDNWDLPKGSLEIVKFTPISETPCGYWIQPNPYCKKKWVSKTGKKRYAYPTIQEARVNFIKRTEKRLKILETQVDCVQDALRQIQTFYKPKQKPSTWAKDTLKK